MPTERTATAWVQLFDQSPLFDDEQKRCYKKQVKKTAMQLDDVSGPFAFEYVDHPEECKCPGTAPAHGATQLRPRLALLLLP